MSGGRTPWLAQRLTALLLAPLSAWLLYALRALPGYDYDTVIDWLAERRNAALLMVLLATLWYHAQLGLATVAADYLPPARRPPALRLLKSLTLLATALSVLALLQIRRIGG